MKSGNIIKVSGYVVFYFVFNFWDSKIMVKNKSIPVSSDVEKGEE